MKRFAVFIAFVAIFSCCSGRVFAGVAEDFIELGRQIELSSSQSLEESAFREVSLSSRESELTKSLLASEDELGKVAGRAASLEPGLLSRLISRVKFEITQENRFGLQPSCQALQAAFQPTGHEEKGKKKIANIYGREVALMDGDWNTAPDGRRFWTSNEYPDIVLTPAEYRRYMATAVTVED